MSHTDSPFRRSSRLLATGTSTNTNGTPAEADNKPKQTRSRRLSTQSNDGIESKSTQPKSATKPTRTRRGSVTSDTSETEPPKTVKTRRTSVSKNEDPEEQVKPKPRGRRGSNASELEVETPKTPVRATRRRGSTAEDVATEVLTPAKRVLRGRKLSEEEEVKKSATRGRRRSVTVDEDEEAKEEAVIKPKRGRRPSVEKVDTPKTPARVTRRNSTGINESKPEDDDGGVKEVTVKLTPLKKKKLVEKVEAELDLSIINESVGDLNVSDPGTPKTSPIKQKVEVSPTKTSKLSPISENIANDTNVSRDSSFSNKENVEVNTQEAGPLEKKTSTISRVSNVFKPNQKECSFVEEPMDVDMSLSVIAPDNSVMENMPPATDSVILSGNIPTITTTDITNDQSEQDSLSLLNQTVTSSTQISDPTTNANYDNLLIEETENTVNISFKNISESPDHSLVVNNTVEQVKVALSRKSSSPIRKSLRRSKSPNVEPVPNSQTLTVSRNTRRSKSKSKTPSPSVKKRTLDVESPKKDQIIENTTEVLQETKLETPTKSNEPIKDKSPESHFTDKDTDCDEILILNDGISPSSTEDQEQKIKTSDSTHYDFELPSEDETNAEDENITADPTSNSVCSQEETIELDLKSKDPLPQEEDKETKNNDITENLNESTVLLEHSTPAAEVMEVEAESTVELMETEEPNNESSIVESTVETKETEEITESDSKPESNSTLEVEQSEEVEVDIIEDESSISECNPAIEVNEKSTSENEEPQTKNIVDDKCEAKPESQKNDENNTTENIQEDTTDLPKNTQKETTPIKKTPRKLKLDDFASTILSEYIKDKHESLDNSSESEDEDTESQENYNEFIDGMAEECEEDTPSEDSNQIIDEGESIGSSDSDQDLEDDSYDPDDSFICDEEAPELLSGDEYDLGSEKKKKGSRIINPETLDIKNGIVTVPKKEPSSAKKPKRCRIITVEDSSSEDEQENEEVIVLDDSKASQNNEKSESIIMIDDSEDPLSVTKNTPLKPEIKQNASLVEEAPPTRKSLKTEETWQNVSLLQNISMNALTASTQKRNRKTSLTLQESIQVDNLNDPVVSQRISSLVQSFCSTIKKGEISLNLSLEYEEDSQEPEPKESEEKTEAVHILSDVKLVTEETPQEVPNTSDTMEYESDIRNAEVSNEEKVEDEVFEEEVPNTSDANNTSIEESNTRRKNLKRRLSKSLSELETETKKSKRRKKNRKQRVNTPDANDLKTATMNLMEQLVTDVKNRPKRTIKPSSSIPEGTWNVSPVSVVKPSTSSATRPKPHPKDFKNQLLNDPNRVRRIETKKLLKRKGVH